MQIQTCSGFLGLVNSSTCITMMQGLVGASLLYCMSPLVIRSLASLYRDEMEAHRGVFILAWEAAMSRRLENFES